MLDILHREFVYLRYYFELQLRQIFPYWVLGMAVGSVISVFGRGPFTGCWFQHLAIEVPGTDSRTEWCESVDREQYDSLEPCANERDNSK